MDNMAPVTGLTPVAKEAHWCLHFVQLKSLYLLDATHDDATFLHRGKKRANQRVGHTQSFALSFTEKSSASTVPKYWKIWKEWPFFFSFPSLFCSRRSCWIVYLIQPPAHF